MYGRRKITRYLRRQGHAVAFCTVDRIMRELGVNGAARGRKLRTTTPGKGGVRAGDKLNRDFTAAAPNHVWVADFTRREALVRREAPGIEGGERPSRRAVAAAR